MRVKNESSVKPGMSPLSLSLVTAYEPARALNADVTTLRVVCPAAIVNAAKDHNHR